MLAHGLIWKNNYRIVTYFSVHDLEVIFPYTFIDVWYLIVEGHNIIACWYKIRLVNNSVTRADSFDKHGRFIYKIIVILSAYVHLSKV